LKKKPAAIAEKKPVTVPKKKPSEKKPVKREASESSQCEEEEEEKPKKKRARKLAEVEPTSAEKPPKPECKGKANENVAKEESTFFRWFPSWSKKQLTESK
jgi:hypothetical protein